MSWKYNSNEKDVLGPVNINTDVVVLTAARTVLASESGTTFILSLAGGFTVTLPSPQIGLRYRFITGIIPTTAYIITATGAIVHGGINELEVDTGDDGPVASGSTSLTLVASALGTVGDWVEYICDGSRWLITGQTKLDGAVTFS